MTSSDISAPSRALSTSDAALETAATDTPRFDELGLPEPLMAAVRDLGFTTPSAIQVQAIPALLAGRDITGVAQTGTGKTAAFGIPMLASIDPTLRATQALVLAPTRELAMQVADAIRSFASHLPHIEVVSVYGGAPYIPQQRSLERGAQIVVGTPGRVIDHMERGALKMADVRFLVLDEADEMLRMGFAEDVDKVFAQAPEKRQVALFSATMPPQIRRVATEHLTSPVEITVARQSSTVTSVEQTYAVVPFRHKTGALTRILATSDADAAIVFCRTRGAAEEVGSALVERGISAATISGDVAQKEREKIVERLRSGALDVLVATDVAARGLDVDRIGLVVNFDLPGEPEAYVHRIGRTGRAGRTGKAISFVTPAERNRLKFIERTIRTQLTLTEVPTPADVSAHGARTLLGQIAERRESGRLELYRGLVDEFLANNEGDVDGAELAAVMLALHVGDDGPRAHAEQVAAEEERAEAKRLAERGARRPGRFDDEGGRRDPGDGDRRPRRENGPRDAQGTRYRLAVGFNHGVQPGGIVGALTNEGGLEGKDLGKIDIFPSFSLVDIIAPLDAGAIDRISRARVGGRMLRITIDQGPGARGPRPERTHERSHDGAPSARRDSGRDTGWNNRRDAAPAGRREGGYRDSARRDDRSFDGPRKPRTRG